MCDLAFVNLLRGESATRTPKISVREPSGSLVADFDTVVHISGRVVDPGKASRIIRTHLQETSLVRETVGVVREFCKFERHIDSA